METTQPNDKRDISLNTHVYGDPYVFKIKEQINKNKSRNNKNKRQKKILDIEISSRCTLGAAWHGVAWCGMVWHGVAWRGMAWHGSRALFI